MSSDNPEASSLTGRLRALWRPWPPARRRPLGPAPDVLQGLPAASHFLEMEADEPGSGARLLDEMLSERERALDERLATEPNRRRLEMAGIMSGERRAWARMLGGYAAALALLVAGTSLIIAGRSVAGAPIVAVGLAVNMALMAHYLRNVQRLPGGTRQRARP